FHITRPSSASWQLRACFRPWRQPVSLDLWPLPAWLRPLLQRALLPFWPQRAWRRALLQSLAAPVRGVVAQLQPLHLAARLAEIGVSFPAGQRVRRAALAGPLWPRARRPLV